MPYPSRSPSPARRSPPARPSPSGSPATATTSPRRWAGRACRPGRSRSPSWSTTRTPPEAPTCTGSSSASTRPTPSWPRPRSTGRPTDPQQRRQGRLHRPMPSGRPTPPLPVHHLRPPAPPRRRPRRQPRDDNPGHRGGRHRPRTVGWHLRPLNGAESACRPTGPGPAPGCITEARATRSVSSTSSSASARARRPPPQGTALAHANVQQGHRCPAVVHEDMVADPGLGPGGCLVGGSRATPSGGGAVDDEAP